MKQSKNQMIFVNNCTNYTNLNSLLASLHAVGLSEEANRISISWIKFQSTINNVIQLANQKNITLSAIENYQK